MKFPNGLHVSLSLSGMPVGERRMHVFIADGHGVMSGGALVTLDEARAFVAECQRAIDAAEAAAQADRAMRGATK